MSDRQTGQPTPAERRLGQALAPVAGDDCLEAPALLALASGSRSARTQAVQDHLAFCPKCRRALSELASLEGARQAGRWAWLRGPGLLRPVGGLALAAAAAAITFVAVHPGQAPPVPAGLSRAKIAMAPPGDQVEHEASRPMAPAPAARDAGGPVPSAAPSTGAPHRPVARPHPGPRRIVVAMAYGPAVPGDAYMENGEVVPGLSRGEPARLLAEASMDTERVGYGGAASKAVPRGRDTLMADQAMGTKAAMEDAAKPAGPTLGFGAPTPRLLKPDPGNATVAAGVTVFEARDPVRVRVSAAQPVPGLQATGSARAFGGKVGGWMGGGAAASGAGGGLAEHVTTPAARVGGRAMADAVLELRQDLAPGLSYRVDVDAGGGAANSYLFRALTPAEAFQVREAAEREKRTPVAAAILYYRAGRYADAVRVIRTAPRGPEVDRLRSLMEARLARRLADPAAPVGAVPSAEGSPPQPLPR